VLDFLSTYCRQCMAELPDYMNLQNKYEDQGVRFIAISLDRMEEWGGKEALKGMLEETKLDWPVYYQGNAFQSDFSKSWGIESMPALFVIDHEGQLRSTDPGEDLESLIESLIEEREEDSDLQDDLSALESRLRNQSLSSAL